MGTLKIKEQFTPGPWVVGGRKADGLLVRGGMSGLIVCLMPRGDCSGDMGAQSEIDARLIAAAPELLEALRDCITAPGATCFRHDDRDMLIRRLRAINDVARDAIKACNA